jgi:hypothetical protein
VSLFAARPIGAHNRHLTFVALRIVMMEYLTTSGRLSVPCGDNKRLSRTVFSASRWLGASVLPVRRRHQVTTLLKSIGGQIIGARRRFTI